MKVGEFVESYQHLPDYSIVLSEHVRLTKDGRFHAIVDSPIVGVLVYDEDKEIRFCLDEETLIMTKKTNGKESRP